ncbi:type IV pilin [Methanocalculus taiwanensis]|uniref:Type IV pilin n=1 Tax=Methanocalculus taiwanensis TaxID=106207 RepID=A0ABD4TMG0_9EURY|nr:type IV pilin N-terminal domain-containing protein [Methanocalculus taiwanensis]MCQ1538964.1 type IV pilin [Methanocalculus taiwanensis]
MKRNDDAVSPVIGVILMVAITVILAAVIAAFVFGLVGNVQGAKVVGLTVSQTNATYGEITWQGGADLTNIAYWNVTSPANDDSGENPQIGDLDLIEFSPGERVIITGTFNDGTTQVIFDKQF